MRSPRLKYLGLIIAISGGLLAASGLYMGSMPYFRSDISDYGLMIIIGISLLIIGLLTWVFVFE